MNLKEWKYMNAPAVKTSSLSKKEKFKKILDYHMSVAPAAIVHKEIKYCNEDGFCYIERVQVGTSGHEYERTIALGIDKKDNWSLYLFKDGKQVSARNGDGFNKLLKVLEFYLVLPFTSTTEYQELLEWVVMKPAQNSSQPASSSSSKTNSKTNKEKFEELLDFMVAHKASYTTKTEVVKVDDKGFIYREYREPGDGLADYTLGVELTYFTHLTTRDWIFKIYKNTNLIGCISGRGWEDLLSQLAAYFEVPARLSNEYNSLCESYSSIADDFKLYENLWD